jgi:hypothetical protein
VEAHVRAPVGLEARSLGGRHPVGEVVEPGQIVRRRALGGEHDDTGLDCDPVVEHGACLARRERAAGLVLGQRGLIRHERAARAAAARDEVAALHQRRDRLAERGARDAELVGQIALRRQPRPRRQEAQPDRGAEPLDRLLECRRRVNGLEYRIERGTARIHARVGHHPRP